jgi:hypothetical protein
MFQEVMPTPRPRPTLWTKCDACGDMVKSRSQEGLCSECTRRYRQEEGKGKDGCCTVS